MGFFDDVTEGYTNPVKKAESTGAIDLPVRTGNFFGDVLLPKEKQVTTTLVSSAEIPKVGIKEIVQEIPSTIGGAVGKVGDVLLAPQRAGFAAFQKLFGLEKEKTFGELYREKPTGTEILKQIGAKIQPTSKIGQLITGTKSVKEKESIAKLFAQELIPTGIGTTIDIFADPLFLLGKLGLIAQTTKTVGKLLQPVAKTITETKIGGAIAKGVIPRFGQPELFQELDKARKVEESLITEELAPKIEPLLKERSAVQQRVAQIIKGGITTDERLKALAEPIRKELDRVGESISKVNPKLLSEETFEANKGEYFPRLYTKYEFPEEAQQIQGFFKPKPVRIPAERFRARKDLPDDVRQAMGEITEAGFPATKGLTQLRVAEIRGKFFKQVADNWANDLPAGNLVQLAENKTLGALSGKFVPSAIADAINGVLRTVLPTERMYNDGLRLWKSFKTAYNPATITRNDLTNLFVLNPLGGVPFYRLDIYARATYEMLTNGQIYQGARKAGLNISNQASTELLNKATELYRKKQGLISQFFGSVQNFHRAVVNFYGNQDKFFKLANIIKGVKEDGLTVQQALKRANFYLIDYSEVPAVVEWLRKSPIGIPFISFTYGVSKPLAKTLLERPDKLGNYFKVLKEIQNLNPYELTREQQIKEYDALPDYIKKGQFLKIPTHDKFGRTMYLDLQYLLPFNPIETKSLLPGQNPLFGITADLIRNKSGFTGKEIWRETDSDAEIRDKALKYVWQQLAPNNPLIPESWSYDKMQDAGIFPRLEDNKLVISPRPDKLGRERNQMQGILDTVFGIKLTPIDVRAERAQRQVEKKNQINDLKSELLRVKLSKTMLSSEKQKKVNELKAKLQEFLRPAQ